jgi:CRP/FNR family transcriptional regulator, cyclic AMP receptor protein
MRCVRVITDIDFVSFASSIGTVLDYRPGDVVFREGDAANGLFIVLKGAVELTSHGKTIETLHKDQSLGIISLIDGQLRTVTAHAIEPSQLVMVDKRRFRYMVEEMPNFCWYVMDELAHRLRATNAVL